MNPALVKCDPEEDVLKLVKNLNVDVQAIGKLFGTIDTQLKNLGDELNTWGHWHPRFHKLILAYQDRWDQHQSDYRKALWRSRDVSANSCALLVDCLETSFPMLSDDQCTMDSKRKIIEELSDDIEKQETAAKDLSSEFEELQIRVKRDMRDWRKALTLQMEKGRYAWDDDLMDMMKQLLDIFGPITGDQDSERTARAKASFIMAAVAPVVQLKSLGVLSPLVTKLGSICNVWAAIKRDLHQISWTFKCAGKSGSKTTLCSETSGVVEESAPAPASISKTTETTSIFYDRLGKLKPKVSSLAQVLSEYQVAVADC